MFSPNKTARQATTNADAGSDPSAKNLSSLLIIEDALIHSTIIGRIADKVGFTATTARSFEEACKVLSMRQFDCITLDLGLGERVGVDVLRHLSAIRCRTPVIVISGSEKDVCDETVRIGKALDLNIYDSVPKPIDLKALRETLAHIRRQSLLQKLASNPV
jgi:two-component system chemotaxis response regulator CheY